VVVVVVRPEAQLVGGHEERGVDDGPLARRRRRGRRRGHQGGLLVNRPRREFWRTRLRSRVLPRAIERVPAVRFANRLDDW